MTVLEGLQLGIAAAITWETVWYCLLGVTLGTLVGVIPGIGALAAISILLPVTYHLDSSSALVMLAGVYYGTVYGGSTAAILLNLPGVPSAAVACLDGYPLTRKGKAGTALFVTTIASFVGSMIGLLVLIVMAQQITALGLMLGPSEYFLMMMLALVASATISLGSPINGLAMVVVGLLLGTVGTDVQTGVTRYTFGIPELRDGVSLVALAMGIFGIAEVILSATRIGDHHGRLKVSLRSMIPSRAELASTVKPMLRGSGIGGLFGALPGIGGTVASFMSYAIEKRLSNDKDRFGKGALEGLAAPEAANNSAVQTAFVPSLTLGIPGDAVMALLLGALIIHGVTPGPLLMETEPALFWGLIVSFILGNIFLVILNIPLIGVWLQILSIPYRYLFPCIVVFVCFGALSVSGSVVDIYMVAVLGFLGWIFARLGYPPAPLILGFVLGPMIEENFRRAMLLSRGDFAVFVDRGMSMTLVLLIALVLLVPTIRNAFNFFSSR